MTEGVRNKRYFWMLLKEPKFISAMFAASYTAITLSGALMIIYTPIDLVDNGVTMLSYYSGGAFLIGGVLGVFSLHGGEWWLERACIFLVWAGLSGYIFAVWEFDSTLSEKAIWTLFIVALAAHLGARFYKIRGLTLDPTK